jgi:hypothetical protein
MVSSNEGRHTVQRMAPTLPVQTLQSFEIVSPVETHFRVLTCKEADCQRHRDGWRSVLDTSTVQGAQQAKWIHSYSGRRFTYTQVGPVVTFTFAAGQSCFTKHQKPLERPELFVVRDGDWRGNPTGNAMRHTQPEHWVEHHAESLDKIRSIQERG